MVNARTYGGYRTGVLWVTAGNAFGFGLLGIAVALFGMMEFDERCAQGLTPGPGSLLHVRDRAFPPATVCEFQGGDVTSVGGHGVLHVLIWAALVVLVGCLLVALVAECLDPPLGGRLVVPMSRLEKYRRTGAAFFVLGSAFLVVYGPAGWKLLAGPSSACAAGADWGTQTPRTENYSLFPPQATCRFTSGTTRQLNSGWAAALAAELAVPALLAGVGFVLARRRLRAQRRAEQGEAPQVGRQKDAAGAA